MGIRVAYPQVTAFLELRDRPFRPAWRVRIPSGAPSKIPLQSVSCLCAPLARHPAHRARRQLTPAAKAYGLLRAVCPTPRSKTPCSRSTHARSRRRRRAPRPTTHRHRRRGGPSGSERSCSWLPGRRCASASSPPLRAPMSTCAATGRTRLGGVVSRNPDKHQGAHPDPRGLGGTAGRGCSTQGSLLGRIPPSRDRGEFLVSEALLRDPATRRKHRAGCRA